MNVELPDEFVEQVAQRVAELLGGREPERRWMTRKQAAEYMGVSVSKLARRPDVPYTKDGNRVLYDVRELDAHLLANRIGNWTSTP